MLRARIDTSVAKAVWRCALLGRGALLVKLDIKSAYRIVRVHFADRAFLGLKWRDGATVWSAVGSGDFLCVGGHTVMGAIPTRHHVHYLDDVLFFLAHRERATSRLRNREEALQICAELGVPVAAEKLGGPVPVLTFLGIELDTERQELRLPAAKLRKTQREIARWLSRSSCVVRELESLIGLLQQAATVVSAGRAFLRRLIALVALRRNRNSVVLLNQAARAVLAWWATFLSAWNGSGFFATLGDACAETFWTDASGSWGCGAVWKRRWCQPY